MTKEKIYLWMFIRLFGCKVLSRVGDSALNNSKNKCQNSRKIKFFKK
jgi:hypothetical protein